MNRNEIYGHSCSGGLYIKLFEGLYEPTCDEVIIYMSMSNGMVWVRPKKVFYEDVELPNGMMGPRFVPVKKKLFR